MGRVQNLQEPGARYDRSKDCVGHWTSETAVVYWTFAIEKPGAFNVAALTAGLADSEFTVEINGQTKSIKKAATGSYENFKPLEIGNFEIKEPGEYKITFKPVTGVWKPVNLKEVVMILVK